jgi:hypothetical protein
MEPPRTPQQTPILAGLNPDSTPLRVVEFFRIFSGCGAEFWGGGGAPPTTLILLRNHRPWKKNPSAARPVPAVSPGGRFSAQKINFFVFWR